MYERVLGPGDIGFLDLDEAIALGADRGRRQPHCHVVVLGVGADEAEDPLLGEAAVGQLFGLPPIWGSIGLQVRHRGEILVHPPGPEDVRALDPEGIPQPLQQAEPDVKDDAAVWGGVGEELVDIVGRRPAWSLVGDDLLEKGPADQPAMEWATRWTRGAPVFVWRVSMSRSRSSATRSMRSEERRVGKECRSRWSPYH